MISNTDLARYMGDPTSFVLEQIRLPPGMSVGDAGAHDSWIVQDVLRPIFATDAAGLPRYPITYIEVGRGHWKSGGVGAVALTEALLFSDTEVIAAAVDVEQAQIILDNIKGYLKRNGDLRGAFKLTKGIYEVPSNGSRVRVISSDVASAWGIGGTHRRLRLVCDELANWPSQELFDAMWSATGKVPDTQVIILSNAGYDAEHAWQYQVRADAEREGYLFSPEGVIASWLSQAWIDRMQRTLPPATFERLILNRWISKTGDFVTAEQLEACIDPDWHPQHQAISGTRYFAGLDLGLVKDRTALAVVHGDGGRVALDHLRVWQGTRGAPVPIVEVENALLDIGVRYPQVRIFADPWQLQSTIQRLKGKVKIEAFNFTSMSVAHLSESLFEMITSGALRLYSDPELKAEILGLRTVQTSSGWRVDHGKGGFSDRAMALGMVLHGYQMRGQRKVAPAVQYDMYGARMPAEQSADLRELYGTDIPEYAIDR